MEKMPQLRLITRRTSWISKNDSRGRSPRKVMLSVCVQRQDMQVSCRVIYNEGTGVPRATPCKENQACTASPFHEKSGCPVQSRIPV